MKRTKGSQSEIGMSYQYGVTALLAAELSTNGEVEDYVIYSSGDFAGKFDDIIARVKLRQQDDWWLWLIQTKYKEKKKLDVSDIQKKKPDKNGLSHYIKSCHDIMANSSELLGEDICDKNIRFGIFCNKGIETPVIYQQDQQDLSTSDIFLAPVDSENIKDTFIPFGSALQKFDCPEHLRSEPFFEKCFLWLDQPDYNEVNARIKSICELDSETDVAKILQDYFNNGELYKQGLSKEVFEVQLQAARLFSFIPHSITLVELFDDDWATIWNEITVEHDITVISNTHDAEIVGCLYRCVLHKLNPLLKTDVDWSIYMSPNKNLDPDLIDKFKIHSTTKTLRYWITPPTTLKMLIVELWKCGDLPLIVELNIPLTNFEKYGHLKRSYIIVGDVDKRSQQSAISKLKICDSIKGVANIKLRSDLLKNTIVSLQGRKEITLQEVLGDDEALMGTLTCANIIRLLKKRVVFLKESVLDGTSGMIFIIENNTYSDIETERGDNIKMYCHQNKIQECMRRVTTDPKLQNYTVYLLQQKNGQLKLIQGDCHKLSEYLIDQDGDPLYISDKDKIIPIIGQPAPFVRHEYVPRILRKAVVAMSFFNSNGKQCCLLSRDSGVAGEDLYFADIDVKTNKGNVKKEVFYFVKIEDGTRDDYWNKLKQLEWPICDIHVNNEEMELLRYRNCKNLSSHISYSGSSFSEADFFTSVINRTNDVIVITGEAGIGKTTLLKSLFNNCSTRDYILFYDLLNFQRSLSISKNLFINPIGFIFKEFHKRTSREYSKFLYALRSNDRVIVILDSFDEIISSCEAPVLRFIRNIVETGIQVIIATRMKGCCMLIDEFNVQSVKIEHLDSTGNNNYLENWKFSNDTLKNIPSEFRINPLYLNLLKTIASREPLANITKLTLYEKATNMIIKQHLWRNNKTFSDELVATALSIFEKFALVAVFGKETIEKGLMWKCDNLLSEYKRYGIIIGSNEEGYPIFQHYTFVEFLVTKWIVDAMQVEIYKTFAVYLYKQILMHNKFDMLKMLSEDLDLHAAIWQKDVHKVEKISKSYNWNIVDRLGRTALHIAVICCNCLDHKYASYEIVELIVKYIQESDCDIHKCDTILNWNWVDYVQPKTFQYACIYRCVKTVEGYLSFISQNTAKYNEIFPLQNFKQIFSWALISLPISSICDLLLLQHFNTNDFYHHYKMCLCAADESEDYDINFKTHENVTLLHMACLYGNTAMVQRLVDGGVDVDILDDFSCTPLCYSIMRYLSTSSENDNKIQEIIQLLLQNGADRQYFRDGPITVNKDKCVQPYYRETIITNLLETCGNLCQSTKKNDVSFNTNRNVTVCLANALFDADIVKVSSLLKEGADINFQNEFGRVPLHLAAASGHIEIFKLLLELGANSTIRDRDGRTVFEHAVLSKNKTIIDLLLKKGSDVNIQNSVTNQTALHCAAQEGYLDIVGKLLDSMADSNAKDHEGNTPIFYAAYSGHEDVISLLLQRGAHVNIKSKYGCTPLHIASLTNANVNAITTLLNCGAKVNILDERKRSPLHFAIENGNIQIVSKLVEAGANVHTETIDGYTPLHFAIKQEHMDIAEILLRRYVNTNVRSRHGITPLDVAIRNKNVTLVKLLLRRGCDEHIGSRDVYTPLHFAAWQGNVDVVKFLLGEGAQVNVSNKYNFSPLSAAIYGGHLNITKLLMERGANVNLEDANDETPLHFASKLQNVDIVKLLLRNGARSSIRNKEGKLPIDFVSDKETEIFKVLESYREKDRTNSI